MKKIGVLITVILLLFVFVSVPTSASEAYISYTYNNDGQIIQQPDLYQVNSVIYGNALGIDSLKTPKDICTSSDGIIYLLDSGNNRVVILNSDLTLKKVIDIFYDVSGRKTALDDAQGIFVNSNGIIYICDTGNRRVIKINESGKVIAEITADNEAFAKRDIDFSPQKIVVDSVGNLYIQSFGTYQGMLLFDSDMNFIGYYGSERVSASSDVITKKIWERFMTEEQREAMSKYVPTEIVQMYIDSDDFIYTITNSYYIPGSAQKFEMDSLRKLNPKGEDISILNKAGQSTQAFCADAKYLNFVDICSDDNGFIYVIDNTKGKICVFSANWELIGVFGTYGSYQGAFLKASAITCVDDKILVLDEQQNNLTVFSMTEYGKAIGIAEKAYLSGEYSQAKLLWEDVIKYNSNSLLAYDGIGISLLNDAKYEEAMEYFVKAGDSERYNDAFFEYRSTLIRKWAPLAVGIIAVLLILTVLIRKYFIATKPQAEYIESNHTAPQNLKIWQYPFYSMLHPDKGFEAMRTRKKTSFLMSVLIMVIWLLLEILTLEFVGKQFEMVGSQPINLVWVILSRVSILAVWTISNWCFCVLIEGKAKLISIFIITLYSMIPYIISGYINIVLNQVLSRSEDFLMVFISALGIIWSVALLFMAFIHFHEFTFSKVLISVILTIIGMLMIGILIFLAYSLVQQLVSAIVTIIDEIVLRTTLT